MPADEMLGMYRQLFNLSVLFGCRNLILKRLIYARTEDSINTHLNVVIAALAMSWLMETATGLAVKRLAWMVMKYRSLELLVDRKGVHAANHFL